MASPKYFVEFGQRFGRLTVRGEPVKLGRKRCVECLCDCGETASIIVSQLFSGGRTSCGCGRAERCAAIGAKNVRHGAAKNGTRSPTYLSWASMKQRCLNQNSTAYDRYGGAGISVCPEWIGADGFKNFVADMGERPEGLTLDRIDNSLGYSPDNCRWADWRTQMRNRRVARMITYNGRTMCASEWAREVGTDRSNISRRLKLGLPLDQVLRP